MIKQAGRILAAIALMSAVPLVSARANLEIWLKNDSSVGTQAIVAEIPGINYLAVGQEGRILGTGRWFSSGYMGPGTLKNPYTVRFQHLSGSGEKYCEWKVWHTVRPASNPTSWGSVDIEVTREYEAPGMHCTSAGLRTVPWHRSSTDISAYITLNLAD